MPFVCQQSSRADGGRFCSAAVEQVRTNVQWRVQGQDADLIRFSNISKLLMSKMCPQNLHVGIRYHTCSILSSSDDNIIRVALR